MDWRLNVDDPYIGEAGSCLRLTLNPLQDDMDSFNYNSSVLAILDIASNVGCDQLQKVHKKGACFVSVYSDDNLLHLVFICSLVWENLNVDELTSAPDDDVVYETDFGDADMIIDCGEFHNLLHNASNMKVIQSRR